jgi:hypothetical protein
LEVVGAREAYMVEWALFSNQEMRVSVCRNLDLSMKEGEG